ncbi:cell envelope-related function transcriptional attenuator common domain-containing protein [Pedococcus dokdonensis]|uniref:Cell envelope-related function transcriptional attenuator common domain-containing protein n=1 Tax=Pedococcus dokdonensis TaxID=443156 RepID=A0A1H0RHT3_9MICO|nr:LCP family protein [Pedococcus dokdonensis]SDP29074.1 cell envelope-related function transcriptional attenuator common domain-containing protein [Pedococcus dokdonensis]
MRPTHAARPGTDAGVYVSRRSGGGLGDADSLTPRMRRRRAFTLVLLTLLVPGSAQLVAGRRGLGRFALRAWASLVALAVVLGVVFLLSQSLAIGLLGRGWVLTVLQWLLAGFAMLWAVLFVDAWRLGRPATLLMATRRWLTGVTAALLVVTSGGLVYAASSVGAGRDAMNALFQGDEAFGAVDGRYNILLLGADSGRDRVGTRPDSIQLVSVDAETGSAVTFGFSRDTENINFRPGSTMARLMPEGWNCGDECLLNGLFTWAQDNRAKFPPGTANPGVLATREAVEALSGLDIQYYVMVDLRGFKKMVDAVGGLDVTVKYRTPIGGGTSPIVGWIEPGEQHLDGYHALWYARSRQGSTNYERMARQRCVMTAMADQLDPQRVLTRFQKIAGASSGLIQTDLPQSELGRFADLAMKSRQHPIRSVNFVPPLMKPWDYDASLVTTTVQRTIKASEQAADTKAKSTKGATTATSKPKSTVKKKKPKAQPGTNVQDPNKAAGNAAEDDLSSVCSAAS